jgi:hypothetical protein
VIENLDEAALWQEYEDALTYFLTHSPALPAAFDLSIREREYNAWVELKNRNLLNSPRYAKVIERARRRADAQQR